MIRFYTLFSILIVFNSHIACFWSEARGEFGLAGSYTLGTDGGSITDEFQVVTPIINISKDYSFTKPAPFSAGINSFHQSASLHYSGKRASMTATADFSGPFANGRGEIFDTDQDYADASISFALLDSFRLVARNAEPIPVGEDLSINFSIEGFLQVGPNSNGVHFNDNRASFTATLSSGSVTDSITAGLSNNIFRNSAGAILRAQEFDPQLGVTATVNNSGDIDYSLAVGLNAFTVFSFSRAMFGNTIVFESIRFVDGSTPEERGFDLVFDSGITSPNLVPEPQSLLIAAVTLFCSVLWRRRPKEAWCY